MHLQSPIKVLVFSHNRPMQLCAYLESLLWCTELEQRQVHVLLHDTRGYDSLIGTFPGMWWQNESTLGGFNSAIRKLATTFIGEDNYVLLGCDDVIYVRSTEIDEAAAYLEASSDVLGVSFRLGSNIVGYPTFERTEAGFLRWTWRERTSHWGYPFDLMSSVYRGQLFREILESCRDQLHVPNDLEAHGVAYCRKTKYGDQPYLAMFDSFSKAVVQDVNRVQDRFPNRVQGTEQHRVGYLKELFQQGWRLDWANLLGISPSDPFVGDRFWRIRHHTQPLDDSTFSV